MILKLFSARKIFLLILIFLNGFTITLLAGTDPVSILNKMNDKLNEIKSGSYTAEYFDKSETRKDTFKVTGLCTFEKIGVTKDSSIIKYRYKSSQKWSSTFNGDFRFSLNNLDSVATIYDSRKYPRDGTYMEGNIQHNLLFLFFFRTKKVKEITDSTFQYSSLNDTLINSFPCYTIRTFKAEDNDFKNFETTIYIRKTDFIPLKLMVKYVLDELHSFNQIIISDLTLNDPNININFTIDSIPSWMRLETYEETTEESDILPPGSQMPQWKLNLLSGGTMESTGINSELTLIDFWYCGCGPCIKSMPYMQNIYDEFKNRGLLVLGFNKHDPGDEFLKSFLLKRKINYPVLLNAISVSPVFHVSSYPTVFLIDKKGTIIYSSVGFSENTDRELRNKIAENLKK